MRVPSSEGGDHASQDQGVATDANSTFDRVADGEFKIAFRLADGPGVRLNGARRCNLTYTGIASTSSGESNPTAKALSPAIIDANAHYIKKS